MQASPSSIVTKESLIDLFTHECLRVFSDRFISQEDNVLFYLHLIDTINDYFKVNVRSKFFKQQTTTRIYKDGAAAAATTTSLVTEEKEKNKADEEGQIFLYGDFLKNDERIYQQFTNSKQLISVLSDYQMRSNMCGNATKQIVFFKEAVEHICRACRVLRQQGGHMLLIGIDGTGKDTIIELAAFISNCNVFKLHMKKGYNYNDFRDDLKNVFKLTGIQRKKLVFFVADKDINDVSLYKKRVSPYA